jgi:septum formation inhibitor-activating ATPase MinD
MIIDSDSNYLNHVNSAFHRKFSDSFEISLFTALDTALKELASAKFDVILADSRISFDIAMKPENCGFAFLVDSADISVYGGQRATCKYQKIDSLCNFIVDLFSESSDVAIVTNASAALPMYVFTSASGGVGTSSAAVACARSFSAAGKPTLYLNFEKIGVPNLYMNAPNGFSMSDVVFAVKSRRPNLSMKLKSNAQQDSSGVYWYATPKSPFDIQELTHDDMKELFGALSQAGLFECIIADVTFGVDEYCQMFLRSANKVVFVSDGSEVANGKFTQAYNALSLLDKAGNSDLVPKISILYNKFSNKTSRKVEIIGLREIGGIPKYEHATTAAVVSQILGLGVFVSL